MTPHLNKALLLVWLCINTHAAMAIHTEEPLPNAALEAQAEILFKQLRCVTCDSQSIYESRAPLAADMRRAVRSQLSNGQSPSAILHFMQQRYGDSILLTPPHTGINATLWLAPFIILACGIGMLLLTRKRQAHG